MDDADCRAAVAVGARPAARCRLCWVARWRPAKRAAVAAGVPGGPRVRDPRADLDAARPRLKKCGHPDGFSTVLAVVDPPSQCRPGMGSPVNWPGSGSRPRSRRWTPRTFDATDVASPEDLAAKGFGLMLAGWTANFPTPGSFLTPLVDGRSVRDGQQRRTPPADDAALNAPIDKARAAGAARRRPWREVAGTLATYGLLLPLGENGMQLVAGQRLRDGVVVRPYRGYDLATAGVR